MKTGKAKIMALGGAVLAGIGLVAGGIVRKRRKSPEEVAAEAIERLVRDAHQEIDRVAESTRSELSEVTDMEQARATIEAKAEDARRRIRESASRLLDDMKKRVSRGT